MSLQATAGSSRKDSDLSHTPETPKSEPAARLCLERDGEREGGRKKKKKKQEKERKKKREKK